MTYISRTNHFFGDIYTKLASFAISPIRDATDNPHAHVDSFWCALLVGTVPIALCLAAVAALFHMLSLMVAGIADCCFSDHDLQMAL